MSAPNELAALLTATWHRQAEDGFLLAPPATAGVEERKVRDAISGVEFRFRWMPHRELRTDTAALERRGILNPDRNEGALFRDPRDPSGRHCFLCEDNIAECHPMEELIPLRLAGQEYLAGANFAWIELNHYTVMSTEHVDQDFSPDVLAAMVELHRRTGGDYRVLYNGAHAGATIPWHLHFQITTEQLPVEGLAPGAEASYPIGLHRFTVRDGDTDEALAAIEEWESRDSEHHRVNVLVAGPPRVPVVHIFARDCRLTHSPVKGLMGGFEMCGDLVYSEPDKRNEFEAASAEMARRALEDVHPPSF